MDALKPFDLAFHRLLFDRPHRERVASGDRSEIGPMADEFANLDMVELDLLAKAIRDGLVRGSLGGLGIGDNFAGTIVALGATTNDVVDRFLADTVSQYHGKLPIDCTGRRAGVSVLESFYEWAATQFAQRPEELCRAQQELAAALLTALARTPHPGFLVAWPLLHAGAHGWYCILDAAGPLNGAQTRPREPIVFAAIRGRYIRGRVSTTLAAVILGCANRPPDWVAEQLLQIPAELLNVARTALVRRGIL